jgi:hypothetical protein
MSESKVLEILRWISNRVTVQIKEKELYRSFLGFFIPRSELESICNIDMLYKGIHARKTAFFV